MTSTWRVAAGASTSSPRDIPRAWAMRKATASVGLARWRSISLSMERLTAQAADISSRVQPRRLRSSLTRRQRDWPISSAGGFALFWIAFCDTMDHPVRWMIILYTGIAVSTSDELFGGHLRWLGITGFAVEVGFQRRVHVRVTARLEEEAIRN